MSEPSTSSITPVAFDTFNASSQRAALVAIKSAVTTIPADVSFHRSLDHAYGDALDVCSNRLLGTLNNLLRLTHASDAEKNRGQGYRKLEGPEDVLDSFQSLVVDAMDQQLERADIAIDTFLGRSRAPAIAVNPAALSKSSKKDYTPKGKPTPVIQHAAHLPKPQLSFKRKVDNTDGLPRPSSLKHKYNARVPLGYHLQDSELNVEGGNSKSLHPYAYEIAHISYPTWMFSHFEPIPPASFEETPFTWVNSRELLDLMLEDMRAAREVAVDLEHHSYRSFEGFVCLMQLSTRRSDWIVDTLTLRDELEDLNEVFTDPKIVKVLHGAEHDIVWLQQNFNLFIVNLFDTFHASKVLGFPRHGLASLLEMYCDFIADKRYQLADWRLRPLPQEMLDYARSDTHFLLYIYDNLRNALLDRAASRPQSPSSSSEAPSAPDPSYLVREVLSRSEITSLRHYEREVYDHMSGSGPNGWNTLAEKWNKGNLTAGLHREVYKTVHAWRDTIAREEDESLRYVMGNHYLFQLAEKPPADMAALLHVFRPVPPIVRRRAQELLDAIRRTVKEQLGPAVAQQSVSVTEHLLVSHMVDDQQADDTETGRLESLSANTSKGLWSYVPGTMAAKTATSTLLGRTPMKVVNSSSSMCTTTRSVLLGDKASLRVAARTNSFSDVLSRIHRSLAVVPSSFKPAHISSTTIDPLPAPEVVNEAPPGQIEVAFVPLAQRQTTKPISHTNDPDADDTIVVVGQRQKKRKRQQRSIASIRCQDADDVPTPVDGGDTSSTPNSPKPADAVSSTKTSDVELFDYSSVPNILDGTGDEPTEEDGKRKKKRKGREKGATYTYGDFPAPPRARREVKSANRSHTFR